MELRHLEYFVAVAEEQHFTRAAERMRVAQSGLSASIRSLERELGAALFVRSTRRVELTEAGRALLAEARRTLASADAARQAVAAVQGLLRGTLAVGAEQCLGVVDVARLLADFRDRHPNVEIMLRQSASADLCADLRSGRLDMAFVATDGEPPEQLELIPLAAEPMMVVCHPAHRFADRPAVDWDELEKEIFVDFHRGFGAREMTEDECAERRISRRVAVEVNDVHSLLDFVGAGLGVAVVPRPIAHKRPTQVRAVPLTGTSAYTWRVWVALPAGRPASPPASALLRQAQLGDSE
ncbi:LysR substrate-binding domain-containing protein [Phytohabitans flavus]|uniref:Transcriptional regulator n=1 Tax=Phytohabitans flavus TaxID=1076124 RepID=A0A6F8Y0S9_9ACTN|nr:LysR family transcriptional regulator [Phytohabitans flavus]BCB79663.1 transcriptional regulator [Phytohabitans flavus]